MDAVFCRSWWFTNSSSIIAGVTVNIGVLVVTALQKTIGRANRRRTGGRIRVSHLEFFFEAEEKRGSSLLVLVVTCWEVKSRVEIKNLGRVMGSGEGMANSGVGRYPIYYPGEGLLYIDPLIRIGRKLMWKSVCDHIFH